MLTTRLLGPLLILLGVGVFYVSVSQMSLPTAAVKRTADAQPAMFPPAAEGRASAGGALPLLEAAEPPSSASSAVQVDSLVAEHVVDAASITMRMVGEKICDLPEFKPDRPALNLTIFVFAWRRLASLQRTMRSLQLAEYCGRRVPLVIMLDGGALKQVTEYIGNLSWPHGTKRIISYDEHGKSLGIRGMWIGAAEGLDNHQHVLPLEDDIEVSPLYYCRPQRLEPTPPCWGKHADTQRWMASPPCSVPIPAPIPARQGGYCTPRTPTSSTTRR
jgi:hypothetical protein